MKKFLIRRILISMILLVFVSMIIYGIMRCMPASFVETKAMQLAEAGSQELRGMAGTAERILRSGYRYHTGVFYLGIQGGEGTVRRFLEF